ncbi:helix-turn-helix domain-containing protein [Agrilactobacillus yilanensis]|uniref:Helix-turn-helix domain-containing protein n=1 Tax=Agrilactobacillus yilanensis TaxID=2485997 RepID=A0ABW4JAJ8_9LACO|nr:helix-turn-helix transcriptional regulator [Agrilactobacillus yilanensis]
MVNLQKSASRIKDIRLKLGLSMQAFAEAIDDRGVRSTVSNWENGANQPSPERMKKIAELGHVSIAYLRGDTDSPSIDEWPSELMSIAAYVTAQQRDIEQAYEDLGKNIVKAANGADDAKIKKLVAIIERANQELQSL